MMSAYRTEPAPENSADPDTPRRLLRVEKLPPAFWTVASILSLVTNAVLIAISLSLATQLFRLNHVIQSQIIGPLNASFTTMYDASIQTTVSINAQVPARFDLPLNTATTVILSQDTYIPNARVTVNTGGLSIFNAPTDIVLPAGTSLPIYLNLTVPVDQTIPVIMDVPVNIPLKNTSLGEAFAGLINVVSPYQPLLQNAPSSWTELICGKKTRGLCHGVFSGLESILTRP
jgi:hypothetical protein